MRGNNYRMAVIFKYATYLSEGHYLSCWGLILEGHYLSFRVSIVGVVSSALNLRWVISSPLARSMCHFLTPCSGHGSFPRACRAWGPSWAEHYLSGDSQRAQGHRHTIPTEQHNESETFNLDGENSAAPAHVSLH